MKDKKLNNLLGMDTFSQEKVAQKAKKTKRTEVAKDVLQEAAYVVGKDILNKKKVEIPTGKGTTVKPTGKEVVGGSGFKNTEKHAAKGLNNLISLSDFTKNVPATKDKPTKRTGTGKDVLNEKAKKEECDDAEHEEKKKKAKKKGEKVEKEDDKEETSGLTAAQKKLPEGLQKAILKRQGKK